MLLSWKYNECNKCVLSPCQRPDSTASYSTLLVVQLAADFEIECSKYGPIEKLDLSWTEEESSYSSR